MIHDPVSYCPGTRLTMSVLDKLPDQAILAAESTRQCSTSGSQGLGFDRRLQSILHTSTDARASCSDNSFLPSSGNLIKISHDACQEAL